jgi:hypothetical protein
MCYWYATVMLLWLYCGVTVRFSKCCEVGQENQKEPWKQASFSSRHTSKNSKHSILNTNNIRIPSPTSEKSTAVTAPPPFRVHNTLVPPLLHLRYTPVIVSAQPPFQRSVCASAYVNPRNPNPSRSTNLTNDTKPTKPAYPTESINLR